MGMMQNIQIFREQAQQIIDSDRRNRGLDILALALNPPGGPPHPGAYPHIVLEMLEQAGAMNYRDQLKQALAEQPSHPHKAMDRIYSRG